MIRIAIIAGVLHSGGKRSLIMEYFRNINRSKIQFDFICDSNSNGIPFEEIESLGGKVYIVPPYKHIIAHLKQTYRILKANKYPVVHAFDNTLNLFPMMLARMAGVKVRISESISKGDKNEKKTLVKLILRPFSHLFANHYMANSVDCGIWQFGKGAYDMGKVDIFKTVINAEDNAFNQELRDATRKIYGWKDKTVYGFIGRYVPQKNPLFLIDIFNEIRKIQDNAILVMIGFGELEEEIMRKVKSYEIEDKVVNLGRRDDIKQFYSSFDTFLLPSLYEGMPVVGIEAQCAGLPTFFSKNITEETTASEFAHYIDLAQPAENWAKYIVETMNNQGVDRNKAYRQIITAGFDSRNEALRLQQYYEEKVRTTTKRA